MITPPEFNLDLKDKIKDHLKNKNLSADSEERDSDDNSSHLAENQMKLEKKLMMQSIVTASLHLSKEEN